MATISDVFSRNKKKVSNKIRNQILIVIEPYVTELHSRISYVQDDLNDIQNELNDSISNVSDLEDEFRHEVHSIQADVEYLPNEDAVNDLIRNYVDYNLSDAISMELSNIMSSEGIDIDEINSMKDALDSLVSELQEIGNNYLSRVG